MDHIGESQNASFKSNKILGAILGSAIGDAMGAPIEMWNFGQIRARFGYVTDLLPSLREKGAEAAWVSNGREGTTSDDTRWKFLVGEYLIENKGNLSAEAFAKHIVNYYEKTIAGFSKNENLSDLPEVENRILRINWILEWVKVAEAYLEGGQAYSIAQNRFYGGEMSCAGLLYSPMFAFVANSGEEAYRLAFEHCLFDIGYARDISSLLSVMTYYAVEGMSFESIVESTLAIDPYGYTDSRLIGRLAKTIVIETKELCRVEGADENNVVKAENYPYSQSEWQKQVEIYQRLDKHKKTIAFHAGEIWQILIASFEFCKGDFEKNLQFIVNYGRDNDTVAAIAGMVLGANLGYGDLPAKHKETVVEVSRNDLNMDIEDIAKKITNLNSSPS